MSLTAFAICRETFGSSEKALRHLRLSDDELMGYALKAAVSSADTVTPGWAAEIVGGQVAAFLDSLGGLSVYAGLAALSPLRVQAGSTKIPTRDEAARIPFQFVGESQPVPVGGAIIHASTVGPHKLAGISVMTSELARLSNFPQVLRVLMEEDAAYGVDSVLLDAGAGSAVRPAGLLHGIVPIPSTGNAADDVAALLAAIGNARRPVVIANNKRAAQLGAFLGVNPTLATALGVILSPSVPEQTLIGLDAWDFATTTGDQLEIDVSNAPAVHMETVPAPLVAGSGTAAKPITSLWQQDLVGYRLVWPLSWTMRRAGSVAAIVDAAAW